MRSRLPWLLALLLLSGVTPTQDRSAYELGLQAAERSLESGNLDKAADQLRRLFERDKKSIAAWRLRARWAELSDLLDDRVYALHQVLRLSVVQGSDKKELRVQREALFELDPIARDLLAMKAEFTRKLEPIADRYEKTGRPHSAIRVLKQILALDPENLTAQTAIERIAASPDPSLAGDAKPKDLFADVTDEWIREHDLQHQTWDTRAKLERENYITYTDAGYEVLVRSAEAMEQMNAFYREFFQYGTEEHGGSVPRIGLNIFKNREEYLEKGIGPPVEWSGGHYTGSFVETYIPASGGFEGMVGTLFHEAAHQFVGLATSAVGWLNEGLASFFEGTRILPNGTVIMNMPASHRLIPLATRMEKGWMSGPNDGISGDDADQTPETAPTFRIVLENKYRWGPPWYAPTWGVVYFLYNYQDPVDGRFVYRDAFQVFIDKSGGRTGEGAVENFEEVVLGNPTPPLKIDRPDDALDVALPRTVEELDEVWMDFCLDLRDELAGTIEVRRPYLDWGRYAAENKKFLAAKEHFEKGLVASPDDIELLMAFADLLSDKFDNDDRAVKLVLEAVYFLERQDPVNEQKLRDVERLLSKLDPKQRTLAKVRDELAAAARAIVARYEAAGLDSMVMDVSWRMGKNLDLADLFDDYEAAVRRSGRSLAIWDLAYNEQNLDGWTTQGIDGAFSSNGIFLDVSYDTFEEGVYDYQFLTLDRVTSGDFSMEAEVMVDRGRVAFAGFVFGQKGPTTFHGLLYMPGKVNAKEGTANPDYVDLMSSFGAGNPKIWRHVPVQAPVMTSDTISQTWRTLRLDVAGTVVDMYVDGELLASHEFSSREVLRGSFGLITGKGRCRFRDVRYLARDVGDQAAAIEREIRFEALAAAGEGAVGGSFQGQVPPFPRVQEWVQGSRTSWDEYGSVPQLLVFFSIRQNDIVPVDEWLMALAKQMESVDLAITVVCSPNDREAIAEYMKAHPLPGDVAIDAREGVGIGESFEKFFIDRFNLPRVLLLDLDQTVIWEGDPGVILGDGLLEGFETYLDTPLDELIVSRRLAEVADWIADWQERGVRLLHAGDFPAALTLLEAAEVYEPGLFPEVDRALAQRAAVRTAVEALGSTAHSIEAAQAGPALAVLLEWGEGMGRTYNKKELKEHSSQLEGKAVKDWSSALKAMARFVKRAKKPFEERSAQLLADLDGKTGRFATELAADLRASGTDEARFVRLVSEAPSRPRLWLARGYFGW
jgi:tetratricopeptide (TPR) repeat protein